MHNFHYITKEDIKEHSPNWSEIPDHPYRILIFGTNSLLNQINNEPDIDKTYLYVKDPHETKNQLVKEKVTA